MSISLEQLAQHNKAEDCWIAVEGKVYDITNFLDRHPGGSAILLKVAGTDATKQFLKFHPTDVIKRLLKPDNLVGDLDVEQQEEQEELSEEDKQLQVNRENMPPLSQMFNMLDFELVAQKTLNRIAWYYYSSGADDEITMRENHRAFQRIWFRPKVMVNVSNVDTSTTMLGSKSSSPFYITATALARLGHEDGELVLTRSAHDTGIIQMLSNLASCSIDEVMEAAADGQPVWQQVYVNSDRDATAEFIQNGEKLGVRGFFVTVDAPQLGRREKDMRSKYDAELADVSDEDTTDRSQGAARAISSFIDTSLDWSDMPWLRSLTNKPLALKGVQRWEDAVKAAECGCDAIVLSNHGGRQLEFSRSGIEVLAEVMLELRKRGLDKKIEVYIDGGVRRGTDVLKAICLGAKGVGIGRPFLYAMSTYGVAGVKRAIDLLNDEVVMCMRLLGVTKLSDLGPEFLDIKSIHLHDSTPSDVAAEHVYEQLVMPAFKTKL